ncbi:unnamed protein product, partial [Ectocarpus sp. 8 AP-2014]
MTAALNQRKVDSEKRSSNMKQVHGVSGQKDPPQQAPTFKGAKRSVGLLP